MSERKHRPPPLDPLIEGYLDYLSDVARKAPGTIRDVRCTLRRVSQTMERLVPDRPLWKLELLDYLRWIEGERNSGRGGRSLNKNLSHLRGFLDYAWRSGRADRNVLDHFAPFLRHPLDGPGRRSGRDCETDGASESGGDGRVPARVVAVHSLKTGAA